MKEEIPQLYLENQLCFPLYAASRLTTKLYAPYLNQLDITYPQYLVLMALWQHDSQSVKEIGNRLYLESNTLTPLLKRMEQKGLIQRTRSTSDERTVMISLTESGQDMKEKAKEIPHKLIESFGEGSVNEEELFNLQRALFKLVSTLNKRTV